MKAIKNVKIVRGGKILPETVLLYDDKILGVAEAIPAGLEGITDGGGLYLSAGLIDLHIHGYGGADTMTHDPLEMAKKLPENGVTAFLPTTMTMGLDTISAAMERIRAAMQKQDGARVLGCHMEGPFIHPAKKGAQDGKYILPPEAAVVDCFADVIKIVTYAPEQDASGRFAAEMEARGIAASVGHTNASYEQAAAAYRAGAKSTTHFFNVMTPLQHRAPGVVGAALESDAYIELIADTIHVHPALFGLLAKLKKDRLCLITDCIEAGGLPDGQYALGGQPVYVAERQARLADGTLAGSVLRLNEGVANMAKYGGVSLPEALQMASENPARLLGISDRMGCLEEGSCADFILLDEECKIYATFVGGECVFSEE